MGLREAVVICLAILALWGCPFRGERSTTSGGSAAQQPVHSIKVEWLGVLVQDVPERVAQYYSLGDAKGVVVTSVLPDSPAKRGGLEWGDLILALEDVEVVSAQDLGSWSGALDHDRVRLGILRAGSRGVVEIALRHTETADANGAAPKPKPEPLSDAGSSAPGETVTDRAGSAVGQGETETTGQEMIDQAPEVEEARESHPDTSDAHTPEAVSDDRPARELRELEERAYALFSQGRLPEAREAYQQITARDPHNAQAQNNLGAVLNLMGRPEEALAAFETAVSVAPGFAQAHFNRGLALWTLGRFEDAVAAYRSASVLVPNLLEANMAEADALLQMGHPKEALAVNDRTLEYQPRAASALRQRGDILKSIGRLEEAEGAYRQALEGNPGDPETLLALGICLDELGRFDAAVQILDKLVATGSGGATAYHNRALAKLHLGDAAGALLDEEVAVAIEPRFRAAHLGRARALVSVGRLKDGVLALGDALEVDLGNAEALEKLNALARRLEASTTGVRQIQAWLAKAGVDPGPPDGVFGKRTTRALLHFQETQGLNATASLNGITLLRLVRETL